MIDSKNDRLLDVVTVLFNTSPCYVYINTVTVFRSTVDFVGDGCMLESVCVEVEVSANIKNLSDWSCTINLLELTCWLEFVGFLTNT